MIIGQVVEILIGIKDNTELYAGEVKAIEEACNLLDKLPRLEEAMNYEPI